MNQLILKVTATNLPSGFCPTDYNAILQGFVPQMSVAFPTTFSGVDSGTTPPDDKTEVWRQLDALGRPIRTYNFAQGKWLSEHPLPPGFTMIWLNALPDFTNFDGGDANALSAISGQMWQQAQDSTGKLLMQGQFPIGAGTLTSGTIINVGQVGGEENHILTAQEMPPHSHGVDILQAQGAGSNQAYYTPGPGTVGSTFNTNPQGGDPASGNPPITALPHNNIPPYFGVYILQRTQRGWYAV